MKKIEKIKKEWQKPVVKSSLSIKETFGIEGMTSNDGGTSQAMWLLS